MGRRTFSRFTIDFENVAVVSLAVPK